MATTLLRRRTTLLPLLSRLLSTTPTPHLSDPQPNRAHKTKSQTPTEKQFETWTTHLTPNFNPSDVNKTLTSVTDPDLAYNIFRWTSHHRHYHHNSTTYLTMIHLSLSSHRHRTAETLIIEILSGTIPPTLPLYNSLIRHCTSHRCLFNRAFDVYTKLLHHHLVPNLDTYAMLLTVLLRKFNKIHVSHVYLNSVRSLSRQMKSFGVIPDTYVLNLIIKANAICLQVDEAVRVFREMGLYGCEPNLYSYSYLVKGCCEKGMVGQGFKWFREMREKGFVTTSSAWCVLVCSLALERRFEDGVEAVRDMIGCGVSPDLLTYRTLLEELCRDGKGGFAMELLEEFRESDKNMGDKNYKGLLNKLHFVNWD